MVRFSLSIVAFAALCAGCSGEPAAPAEDAAPSAATYSAPSQSQTSEAPVAALPEPAYDAKPQLLADIERDGKAADAQLVECLNERGWTASTGTSGYIVEVEPEDDDALAADEQACGEQVGMPAIAARSASPEVAEAFYDIGLKAKTCFEAQGFAISEPPTREQFIIDYTGARSADAKPYWMPHREIPRPDTEGMTSERYQELFALCPPPG